MTRTEYIDHSLEKKTMQVFRNIVVFFRRDTIKGTEQKLQISLIDNHTKISKFNYNFYGKILEKQKKSKQTL